MGKIQWVVNRITGRKVFKNEHVSKVEEVMGKNKKLTVIELLSSKKL
jgi:hypothetical protein